METENSAGSKKERNQKKKSKKLWRTLLPVLLVICIALLVCLGLGQLFRVNETVTTTEKEESKLMAMVCEADFPKDPFFEIEGATDVEHTVKVTYRNDVADKISYEYDAELPSAEAATQAEAETHAKYNLFMGNNSADFSAQFMPMGNEYKINIFTSVKNLGSKTAQLFFISEDEFNGMKDFKIENLRKAIQGAGFHCEMEDED